MHAGRQTRASETFAETLSTAAHMPFDVAAAATEQVMGRARQLAGGMAAHQDAQPERPLVHEDSAQMRQADHRAAPGDSPVTPDGVEHDSSAAHAGDAEAGSFAAGLAGHKQQQETEPAASLNGMPTEEAPPNLEGPSQHGADASAPDLEAASPSGSSSTEEVSMLGTGDARNLRLHAESDARM